MSSSTENNNKTSSEEKDSDAMSIFLTLATDPGGPKLPLTIHRHSTTPTELRKAASTASQIALTQLKLIFRGRIIADDEKTLVVAEYKLQEGNVIHCMGKPAPAAAATTTGVHTSAGGTAVSTPSNAAGAHTMANHHAAPSLIAAPVSMMIEPLPAALSRLRSSNTPSVYQTAVTTLDKIITNIIEHPLEEKYRRMKKQNPAFARRLGSIPGGDEALRAVGFVVEADSNDQTDNGLRGDSDEMYYVLHASPEAWPNLMAAKTVVQMAMQQINHSRVTSVAPSASTIPSNGVLWPPLQQQHGDGGDVSQAAAAAASMMMSNPAQIQAMFQDPMVQAMIRNDPRFANNPMAQQALEQMASNPAMMQQMSRMMADPNAMAQVQQMMRTMAPPYGAGTAALGGLSNNGNISTHVNSTGLSSIQQQQQPTGTVAAPVSDDQQTEEEMIAEAIRRSLQDT